MRFDGLGEHTNFLAKNPSLEAYRSVRQVNNNDLRAVKVLVSIGTGRNSEAEQRSVSRLGSIMNALAFRNTYKEAENIHQLLLGLTKDNADYFRLNVEHGLGTVAFDEWKGKKGHETLELIQTKTEEYLKSPEVKSDITEIAKHLVDIRRERSTWKPDLDRWERFCHGMEYTCPVSTCKDDAKRYKTRRGLQAHLKARHSIKPDKLEPLLDAGKRYPLDEVLE